MVDIAGPDEATGTVVTPFDLAMVEAAVLRDKVALGSKVPSGKRERCAYRLRQLEEDIIPRLERRYPCPSSPSASQIRLRPITQRRVAQYRGDPFI